MKNKHGFTLVEVLAGLVVISVIGTCSYFAVNTLFQSGELSRSRNTAVNLLQKSQEEVRAVSRTNFDTLESCRFPGESLSGGLSNCGLSLITEKYPGYTRQLAVSLEAGTSELKKAVITVTWDDFGKTKSIQSAVLLARPPDPLPGNIIGTIRNSKNNNIIVANAQVSVTNDGGSLTNRTTSIATANLNSKNVNYDFQDPDTGRFLLPPGNWQLTAKATGYKNYTHSQPITVTANREDPVVDFFMEPDPEPAKLNFRIVNSQNGNSVLPTFYGAIIWYIDDAAPKTNIQNQVSGQFTIPFTSLDPKKITINTYHAYKVGFAYRTGVSGGTNCQYPYNYKGWSSSVMPIPDNGTLSCTPPWNGDAASDRLIVESGQTYNIDIPLQPVPTATIQGIVTNQNDQPIANAVISAKWPPTPEYAAYFDWNRTATTDANGRYTFVVPAVQAMMPDGTPSSKYLAVYAKGSVPSSACCNSRGNVDITSGPLYVGPLLEGTIKDANFKIGDSSTSCGNAEGKIRNGSFSDSEVSGATVKVQGVAQNTDHEGEYEYVCPGEGFKLPVGTSPFIVTHPQFYAYTSAGNFQYNPAPAIVIKANEKVTYNAKLWPLGKGTIDVVVTDIGRGIPLGNKKVKLSIFSTTVTQTVTTDNSGHAVFPNIQESWPPPELPNELYYNRAPSSPHKITVEDPDGIYTADPVLINDLRKSETRSVPIGMSTAGAT